MTDERPRDDAPHADPHDDPHDHPDADPSVRDRPVPSDGPGMAAGRGGGAAGGTGADDEARLRDWVDRARVQSSRAHAVYSDFPVGAVVVSADGNLYDGVNVENAAYGLTMCAERVAIGSMVAAGDRSGIAVVAVAGRGSDPLTPCGSCRQVIAEFATPGTQVVSRGGDGTLARWTVEELLPDAFGPLRLAAGADAPDGPGEDADVDGSGDVGGAGRADVAAGPNSGGGS